MTVSVRLLLLFAATPLIVSCDSGPSGPGGGFGSGSGGSNWGGGGTDSGSGSDGGDGGDSGDGGDGGDPPAMTFDGPTNATPTDATSIAIEWSAATITTPEPTDISYDLLRAETVDMAEEILVTTISDGATSFVDSGLNDNQTYFYRVSAYTDDLASDNADIVSSHLPEIIAPGIDYMTTIDPLWSRLDDTGTYTCLDCHDGSGAQMELTTWQGLVTGVGIPSNPDSFILPTLGKASFEEAVKRIKSHPSSLPYHKLWASQASVFQTEPIPWIDEGAVDLRGNMSINEVELNFERVTP